MARAKRKQGRRKNWQLDADLPTPEQIANGDFERDFITHAESNTKAMAYRRRDSNVVEKWIREGAVGFEQPAQRAIADCQALWARMGVQRLTAAYGERIAASTHSEGYTAQEASDEIAFRKSLVPRAYWDVFENVIRHNEPAGVAGSAFATNRPQQIASARAIVGLVANVIAMRCGY